MYRVIHKGLTETSYMEYKNLIDAYRSCELEDDITSCRLLFSGLIDKLDEGNTVVHIFSNKHHNYWIQCINDTTDPVSELPLDCCNHH
jgi:hypothetical protein